VRPRNRNRLLRRSALGGVLACVAGAVLPVAPAGADPGAPTIAGTPAPGVVGSPYAFPYDVTGDPSCSAPTGTLPPGLDFEAGTCILSGTPTAAGSYPFTVTATNGISPDATIDSTVEVSPAPPTITGTPPPGQFWSLYTFTFTTTGTPTVTVSAGTPPPGLTLAPDGTLSGRPTRAGTYAFTVRADNGVDPAATEAVQIVIVPKPHITVTDARARERNAGLTAMTFVVSLTRAGIYDIPVHWTTANGTATAPSDFQAASGDLTFAPGELSKTITVWVRGDRRRERNETFTVRLSRTTHAEFDDQVAVGTIVNDD
jgi:hypothetical protein